MDDSRFAEFLVRLDRIERKLDDIATAKQAKEYYSTDEVAEILSVTPFTAREWCRLGRVHATKRRSGQGRARPWMISHEELTRIKNEGLLPLGPRSA